MPNDPPFNSAEPAVALEGVTKRFGRHVAVDDISLSVPAGCVYGFIGPNGSGKTTTLRMIMRIYLPDSGVVRVLGESRHAAARDDVAYLPEERGLYKQMKVADTIRFYGELKGHRATAAEIDGWLDRLGLGGWGDKRVDALSKGMSQKVQFIATVIGRPRLVILDEPFSGLDPVNAVTMREMVLDLKRQGTTVIFSTHDMGTAEQMCDAILMIYQGKKVLDGSLESIRRAYAEDVIRVRLTGANGADLSALPGVSGVTNFGNRQELRTNADADPQAVLAGLMRLGRVEEFEVARPSLQDIFVRIASPAKEELTTENTEATGKRGELAS